MTEKERCSQCGALPKANADLSGQPHCPHCGHVINLTGECQGRDILVSALRRRRDTLQAENKRLRELVEGYKMLASAYRLGGNHQLADKALSRIEAAQENTDG